MRKLTKQQRQILELSPHVEKTTESHVIYTTKYKLKVLELSSEGLSPKEIFIAHGFDFDFFDNAYFKSNVKRWRKLFNEKGKVGLKRVFYGGRKKKLGVENLTEDDLRAIVRIQAEVIEQLKKRKALAKKK